MNIFSPRGPSKFHSFFLLQDSDEDEDDDQDGTEEETEVIIPNVPTQMMVSQLTTKPTAVDDLKPKAPPAIRVTRKLTRPERQLKLEQHLEEQLERMNEMKGAGRTDKETNTECVFMHPNQSTIMRLRLQQQQQQQQQQLKNDYLTVKRSKTFNTRTGPEGSEDNADYICRVSLHRLLLILEHDLACYELNNHLEVISFAWDFS